MDFKNIEIHLIQSCDTRKADIRDCNITESTIQNCFMDYTRVSGSRWGNAFFNQMFMEKCLFNDVNLNGSSFLNLAMLDSKFENCTLNGAKFEKLAMEQSEFNDVNLSGSKFINVDLSGAEIEGSCVVEGMTIAGIPVEELLRLYKEKLYEERNMT